MTGYQSKKAAASAKTIDEVNWADHEPNGLAQPEQEPVAWKNAATRLGEELASVGPEGYYDMTAEQWLDWAMAQEPRGKNKLAQPAQQEPVAWMKASDTEWSISFFEEDGYVPLYTTPPKERNT